MTCDDPPFPIPSTGSGLNGAQLLSFALVAGTVIAFASGRFRYDLVALTALLLAVVSGDVPAKQAFTGFTSDVVIVIASALIISAAVARSGVVELVIGPAMTRLRSAATQVPAMAGATALLSMLTKNVGALAILMPTAIRLGRAERSSASALLMPMSFMSLLGGLVTLVGTSTNIIVSQVREEALGQPFRMFDFAPVGLTLTAAGLVFVSFGWRLLPRDRTGKVGLDEVASEARYTTEARLGENWPAAIATLADLNLNGSGVRAAGLVGPDGRRRAPLPDAALRAGQVLLLEGEDEALGDVFNRVPLHPISDDPAVATEGALDELRAVEAVVQPGSRLVGATAARADLQERHGVKLLAVARGGTRFVDRLRDITIRPGDMLVMQAGEKALPELMRELGLLPLAERVVHIGARRWRWLPIALLVGGIVLVAAGVVPVAIGFFGAAVLTVVSGGLSMREAYGALEPEVLVLIGALTPLSEAVQHSGGTALVAHQLASLLHGAPPIIILGALMVTAMACSPFLHNAPTVLVLGPIGLSLAQGLQLNPDPFLMAVATGAGCDFLTPIGHQCNTLVMGPGGYRFGDYWRLGLPLSFLVIVAGTPLIAFAWSL